MTYILSEPEISILIEFVEELTGTDQSCSSRKGIICSNISNRILHHCFESLIPYLEFACANKEEYRTLLSLVTIHTTAWFRESPHFSRLEELVLKIPKNEKITLRVASVGCSGGPEVFSIALVLEEYRLRNPNFDYRIEGYDIDHLSIEKARKAVFPISETALIPPIYKTHLLRGSGAAKNLFTLTKEIRNRCTFEQMNITSHSNKLGKGQYDVIFCRNVLIYFDPKTFNEIVTRLLASLKPSGCLFLAHCELISCKVHKTENLGNSVYRMSTQQKPESPRKRKVLIVDDSKIVRTILKDLFDSHDFITVVASSAKEATIILKNFDPDIVSLDLHMPETNGDVWLKNQRRSGFLPPTILVSDANPKEAFSVLSALGHGAQDYIEKRLINDSPDEIMRRFKAISDSHTKPKTTKHQQVIMTSKKIPTKPDLIMIGASTGGIEAIKTITQNLPKNFPPLLIVQHISSEFAKQCAHLIAGFSGLTLVNPEQREELKNGHIYMTQASSHIKVQRLGERLICFTEHGNSPCGHKPSVDVLFSSVAKAQVANAIAIILTGMGKDGSEGIAKFHSCGGFTIAQDEGSSVVFGMPSSAISTGKIDFVGNPAEIRDLLLDHAGRKVA